jgi:putative lipoprotein
MKRVQPFRPFLPLTIFLVFVVSAAAIAGELAGSEWRPTQLASSAMPSQSKLFVQFKVDGKLTGHGGCNRFFGQYKITANDITIGPVGATRMACPKPVMDMELAFFAALESAKTYRRDKANLVLIDATGKEQLSLIQTDRD